MTSLFLTRMWGLMREQALPLCAWCQEEVQPAESSGPRPAMGLGDDGRVTSYVIHYHHACEVRSRVGSVEHQRAWARGEFDCRAHRHGEEPEHGTPREHARFAAAYFYEAAGLPNPDRGWPGR